MIGENGKSSPCPLCGGRSRLGVATIPFVLAETVVVIKDVPAEICSNCHEPYMTGQVTDRLTDLLQQVRAFHAEVSILAYTDGPASSVLPLVHGAKACG
ncbi:MAG: type II toxin-antitoxin system MqsA family antitoxin [Chloroflexi bacterium]|nr:type II toxin-antitoxin system MqsA family antitoxin [Chloroflexota bacterium]